MLRVFLFFFLLSISAQLFGQRIEIDRLERDFEGSFRDREAYELSQKFIQIDSTYYTGHYFEALYRYFRASDQLGYQQAIKPLTKAIFYMDKDYSRELRRTTDLFVYINTYQYQRKYAVLIDLLEKCYQYTNEPDKAIGVIRKLIKKDFVFNFGVQPYASLSWIYHRNRTYKPDKYPFLKNSIEENVQLASKFADSIKITTRKNQRYIRQWFADFANGADGSYYHFKDLIYSYLLKIDSAEYCAAQLERLDNLSKNNYGNLQFIQANYEKAEEYYDMARDQDGYQFKSTKEFDYMQSVIRIFKNDLKGAELMVANSLDVLGPTPGFGWNNIAMARVNYYAGDLEKSKEHADKAAQFLETHINSTWGKLQYDRNTLLFEYLYHQQKIKEIRFNNKFYWLSLNDLTDIAYHFFKKENAHLILTSDLSANPERFLVLYNIFATENTIFFDEIWEIIKTFNSKYFIRLFEEKRNSDPRPGIIKYYNYYIAKFHLEDGEDELAISHFQKVLEDATLDPNYEKLLIGRVYEGLALAYDNLEMPEESDSFLVRFYETYPQLVPFSPLKMKMNLEVSYQSRSEEEIELVEAIKSTNLQWTEAKQENLPTLQINFEVEDGKKQVAYSIVDTKSEGVEGRVRLETAAAEKVIYAAFGIKFNPTSKSTVAVND
ncbi:MAG: hypothetical protein RJQ09_14285 [Cyclobacteriaceae bacterium]